MICVKHLFSSVPACGCYTVSGRLRLGPFRNFFWVSIFSTCSKRVLENTFPFWYCISAPGNIWDHLLKYGLLFINRQKEHSMDNLKCWFSKELAIFALECGEMTALKISFNLFICLSLRLSFGRVHVYSQGCGGKAIVTSESLLNAC